MENWYFHRNASRQQLGKCLPKAGYLLAQQKTADIYSRFHGQSHSCVTVQKGGYFFCSGWKDQSMS